MKKFTIFILLILLPVVLFAQAYKDYYQRYYVKSLSVTTSQQVYTFPKNTTSIKIANDSGSAAAAFFTLSERNYTASGWTLADVDTTQADTKTTKVAVGEFTFLSLDSKSMAYKCAADTATLQVTILTDK